MIKQQVMKVKMKTSEKPNPKFKTVKEQREYEKALQRLDLDYDIPEDRLAHKK